MNENIIPINRHTQEMPHNGSMIENSGNSKVYIDIHIDTMPIAFAILCSALAAKQMTKEEFDTAYTQLQEMNRDNSKTSVKQINNQEIEEE
ncbi:MULTISPECIES: hypothetical protein [unclassified Bacillus (in: firmicutes)]|uniref:hypothetical protein n=1 Tax=unclassified Bacillus (in: firmicutes) TaxID=185979 RepID=UPI00228034BE|nr:hypothetical protein [Bacillus sp. S20C3]MCY8204793.1 hypothetical protein [Bacillus sp. N12A5]MCY8288805.1 hypothetical protein [Bacillus sp. N13C7]MCY8638290.1 hypothetical protein [Bacillus sp. S17B2]MCY8719414.1 hypothetical protein [Bacillus sp. S10C12M]MCY9142186.1 hypothetical protein [Bacillus sp. T9C1]